MLSHFSDAMICPNADIMVNPVGNITTGPGFYLSSKTCTWTIAPPNVSSIQLIFRYFGTENSFDIVSVFQCSSIACTSPKILGQFSGDSIPAPFNSSTGIIRIVFTSDQIVVNKGFHATYISLCPLGYFRNETGMCQPCLSTCQVGQSLSGQCRPDITLVDQMHCDCPAGQFSPSSEVSCQPCTKECSPGK
jgi:hypothetical protein